MNIVTQYYIRIFRPFFYAFITRLVYTGRRVKIGKNFKTDSIPKILVDKNCKIEIGDSVEFRRNIELRSHGKSKIKIENNVRIDRGVRILAANNAEIMIQDGARVGLYTVFNGGDSITVGKKALISGFVYLQTSMHGYKHKAMSVQDQGYEHAPVILAEDTWLGTHVVILPGVMIGKGAVVGSNAVVNKNVEQWQVVGGIPAKILKERQ